MFSLSPSDVLTITTALAEASAAHAHESTGPDDRHARTAERYQEIRAELKRQFDAAFPLTVR